MLSQKIKEKRKKAGLLQFDLAKATGVSIKTIARWESGEREPNASDLLRLASALNTSVSYLMGENLSDFDSCLKPTTQIKNSQKTINTSEESTEKGILEPAMGIVFEYKTETGSTLKLTFPHGATTEEMERAIEIVLSKRGTKIAGPSLSPAVGGDIAGSQKN